MVVLSMRQVASLLFLAIVLCVCLFDVPSAEGAAMRPKRSIWNSRIMDLKRQIKAASEGGSRKGTSYGYLFRVWPPRYRKREYDIDEEPLDDEDERRKQMKYDLMGYY